MAMEGDENGDEWRWTRLMGLMAMEAMDAMESKARWMAMPMERDEDGRDRPRCDAIAMGGRGDGMR